MTIHSVTQQAKNLFPYFKRYRAWGIYIILAIFIKESAVLFEPYIYGQVIDVFERLFRETIDKSEAVRISVYLIGAFIVAQTIVVVSNTIMLRFTNVFQTSIMRDVSNDFVEKVLTLSFRFHAQRKTGKLATEFARGVGGTETFMDSFAFNLIPLVVRIAVIFVVFLFIDWPIALVMTILATAFVVFTVVSSLKMQGRRTEAIAMDDEGSRKAMDALMNAEVVKYFQQEDREVAHFRSVRQKWKKSKLYEWNGWVWVSAGQILINVIAVTLILGIMILRLLEGSIELSSFVVVVSYMTLLIGLLWDFQHFFRELNESLTDLSAFFDYFKQDEEAQDATHAPALAVTAGAIEFDHLSFHYGSGKKVLEDVSFKVHAGASVAFVGPSGVGKSTIIKLLYRFYEPQSGRILIDGQDISHVTKRSLREALGIVPQDTALFNETVAYNIAYGSEGVTQEDIHRAATLAHCNELIERLPEGYETLVGERGVRLSGGEKQRISIARSFLRNSPILILDEATASLDSASEYQIQTALNGLMEGRTTLIIAHRLSTIMNADHIIVLNEGGIEQQGTHEELLEHGGLYNRLWALQAGGYIE